MSLDAPLLAHRISDAATWHFFRAALKLHFDSPATSLKLQHFTRI
jgi:hypothetical protein